MIITSPATQQTSAPLSENHVSRLSILRLTLSIGETSSPYNQFSLACRDRYNITIGTFFRSAIEPPTDIKYYEGDDTLLGFLRVVRQALSDGNYDVVHIHTPHVGFLYYMATAFRNRRALPASVYTVHSSIPCYKKLRTKLLLIPNFLFARKIVCCSRASYASVPRVYRWLAGPRLTYVQNGVDLARIDQADAAQPSSSGRSFVVSAVGRLIAIKNPLTILDAYEESFSPGSQLFLVGTGPLESRIRQRSDSRRDGPQVEITGLVSRERVYRILGETHLYVSASHGEGLPIATLEAMASRCPVVLSDIPAHREIVGDADFIPLVPPNDVAGFAREIRRFQQMAPLDRRRIGDQCRALVETRFSLNAMHDAYDGLYRSLLAEV